MPYRNRRRRKSFMQRIGDFLGNLGASAAVLAGRCGRWFKKKFPARKPGEPIYKSRRLMLVCAAVIVAAAVLVPVIVFVPRNADVEAQAQVDEQNLAGAVPSPTPEIISLSTGSTGERVYELKERLMELGYLDSDELIDEIADENPDGEGEEPEASVEPDVPDASDAPSASAEPSASEGSLPSQSDVTAAIEDAGGEEQLQSINKQNAEFNDNVRQAVMRFQILSNLEATGSVDNSLWEKIFANDAPVCVLTLKMEGDDIKEYQTRLRDLNYISSEPTGYFGTDTEEAVKLFQEKNNLTSTGTIDMDTQEMLYSEDVAANYISFGQKSDEVAEMQQRLIKLGYLSGEADGSYGNQTLAAVKLFQKKNDLVVDGYLGYQSKQLLMSGNAEPNAFSIGDEGTEVQRLQNRLVKLKYISKATGYFGSDTDLAVKNFQKLNGLSVDGKAGPMTLAKLYSSDAVVAKNTIKVGQSSKVNKFIEAAASKLGHKYVGGGKGPNVFDCSGLVYWCLKQAGVNQSYVTSVTWRRVGNYKTIKDIDDVRKGDIICFSPHHVGIAISSSTMIDASSGNGKVVKRSFKTAYWRRAFVCARRVF